MGADPDADAVELRLTAICGRLRQLEDCLRHAGTNVLDSLARIERRLERGQ